ncbi:MAG: nicotinate-nucleotide adenylyltransferase [Candidatus Saccharimonadales bacterium]
MKKIGIFSGSFDPIHQGHTSFAKEALSHCQLDKVFFLVEPRPRRKQGVKALEHRVKMVQLALHAEPQLGLIVLEQARFNVAETLPVLEARFQGSQLYMLLGEDVLSHLAHWPQIEQLTAATKFIVGIRRHTKVEIKARLKTIENVRGIALDYDIFRPTHNTFASSSIRLQIKRGHQPDGLIMPVRKYIRAAGLYAPADDE